MDHLKELEKKKQEIEQEIAEEKEKRRQKEIEENIIRIACPTCEGKGTVMHGGADIMTDPPYAVNCDQCGGSGCLLAVPFKGKQKHDMKGNEIY